MNSEAKHYLEDGDHVKALEQYFTSLVICSAQNLTEDAASIHIECAVILLQRNSYYQAYRHANTCIKFKPFYEVCASLRFTGQNSSDIYTTKNKVVFLVQQCMR